MNLLIYFRCLSLFIIDNYKNNMNMANSYKNVVRVRSSYHDQQLFQVMLIGYDPKHIKTVSILYQRGHILKKDACFGMAQQIQYSAQGQQIGLIEHQLSLKKTLIIQSIGEHFRPQQKEETICYNLEQNIKKGGLMLLCCRQCDHESPLDQENLNGTIKSTQVNKARKCMKCNEEYSKAYEKVPIQITMAEFLASQLNPYDKLNQIQWQIKLNQQFTPNTSIAKFKQEEITLSYVGKAVFLINFQENYKKITQETVAIKIRKLICNHDKILGNKCLNCLLQIIPEAVQKDYSNFLIQGDNKNILKIKGEASNELQQKYILNLLNNKKLVMVLDLDNTILHANQIWELNSKTIKQLKEFYVLCREENNRKETFIVKMRPFFKHFIFEAIKYYQIYVYTKGTRVYAEEICKCIRMQYANQMDSQYPYKTWENEVPFLQKIDSFKLNRIISRDEDPNLNTKNIFSILPHSTEYHLILDDRRDVWSNSENWYFTVPYNYFIRKAREEPQIQKYEVNTIKTELQEVQEYISEENHENLSLKNIKQHLIQQNKEVHRNIQLSNISYEIQSTNKEDYYLLFAAYFLRKAHHSFFQIMRKQKEKSQKSKESQEVIEEKNDKEEMIEKVQSKSNKKRSKKVSISEIYVKMRGFWVGKKVRIILGEKKIEPPHHHRTIQRAKKLGLSIIQNNQETPQIIIRVNKLISPKHQESQDKKWQESTWLKRGQQEIDEDMGYLMRWNKKIPIVSETWIHLSYQYTFPFPYEDFMLDDPLREEVLPQEFDRSIEKIGKSLQKQIEERMKRQVQRNKR